MTDDEMREKIAEVRKDIRDVEKKMRTYPPEVRKKLKPWLLSKKAELNKIESSLDR